MGFASSGFGAKSTKTVINITAFKVMCSLMAVRARSKTELNELTGLTNTTVSRWMRVLSTGRDRIVYVEYWCRKGERGGYTAMWRLGHGMPDAPKPKALTNAQYLKRWRAKQEQKKCSTKQTDTGLPHQIDG